MALCLLLGLETSVLKASHQKMGVGRLARLEEREQICARVSHMDDQRFCGRAPQAVNLPHPDLRFSGLALSSVASGLAFWCWRAHKRLLDGTAQHLTGLRDKGQHCLQRESSPVADLAHTGRLGVMREVHFCGVLHQQHRWPSLTLLARLVSKIQRLSYCTRKRWPTCAPGWQP